MAKFVEPIRTGRARVIRTGEAEAKNEMFRKMMTGEVKGPNHLPMVKRVNFGNADRLMLQVMRDITKRQKLKSMKKGGKVTKTGPYLLHKDEMVVPAKKRKLLGRRK